MLRFLTAGESHGRSLIAIVDGLPSGMKVEVESINHDLSRRQLGFGRSQRMKIEHDQVEVLSGVISGHTTGAPVALRIKNYDWDNWRDRWASGDLERLTIPRPGHADYAGMVKYRLNDARPILERASARETAARVAVGSLAKQLLSEFGITIGSYVTAIGDVEANIPNIPYEELWAMAESSEVRCPSVESTEKMKASIEKARQSGDTLGGIFVTTAINIPAGLGSHTQWDRKLDARLASAVMSIQGVKGVEIGQAFENSRLPGTQVHDDLYPNGKGGIIRRTNRAGGLEGGMTNGAEVIVRAAMKPIPTTAKPHDSVDMDTGKAATAQYQRSDICAVPRAAVVGESMVAWALAEAILEKYGGDSVLEMKR